MWIGDDIGIPTAVNSVKYNIPTNLELTSFKRLTASEVPELAVPYGYKIRTAAEYVDTYQADIPRKR